LDIPKAWTKLRSPRQPHQIFKPLSVAHEARDAFTGHQLNILFAAL
jgi:hypothetical protein